MYFRNSQASRLLPMPAGPMTDTRRARRSRDGGVEQVLEQPQLVVAPTNGASSRSSRPRPPRSATTRSARHAATGAALPLRTCSPAGSNAMAPLGRALGRLAHEHGARRRHRLEPRRGVDEVARDHALVGRADGHRRLTREHPAARLDARTQGPHRVDELQGGADRALGVVLVRDRRAPHGHHRVADELLDRAAVAVDRPRARGRSSASAARAPPPRRGPRRAT